MPEERQIEIPWYIGPSDQDLYLDFILSGESPPQNLEEQRSLLKGVLALCQRNPAFLLHTYMNIRAKAGGRARFCQWTPAQKRLYQTIRRLQYEKKPVRIVILKARQMGISTLCEGLLFWRTALFRDATSMIVAHEEDAVTNIYRMFQLYYESMPDAIRPLTEKFNQSEIVFDNPNVKKRQQEPGLGSRLIVKTAALGGTSKRQSGKGRSGTYHAVHASEAAYWAEPEKFWGGVQNAVPRAPSSMVLIESTANGHGNWFHHLWREAAQGWEMTKNPATGTMEWGLVNPRLSRSSYVPVFLSWLEHSEYRLDLPCGDSEEEVKYYTKSLDKEEKKLVKHFGATLNQIEWRRQVLTDECNKDVGLFNQEYPVTPEMAFISTGRRVFDMGALDRAEDSIRSQSLLTRCDIESDLDGDVVIREDAEGPLYLYRRPVEGVSYSMGVDTSYNKPHGDFSCIQVLRNDNWEQVAVFHARVEADQLAVVAKDLGMYYNEAMVVIEIDGPGLATAKKLGELDYWNTYRRINPERFDNKRMAVMGWRMTQKARANMVANLKAAVRTGELILNDAGTIGEMRDWVLVMNSNSGRSKECPADPTHGYDDRITSLGIALVGGVIENGLGGVPVAVKDSKDKKGSNSPSAIRAGDDSHPVLGSMF